MRLIDANALKAKLKIGTNTATYSDYCNGYCDARQVDLDAIDAAPIIEAEPVRHGRWIESQTDLICSVCKWKYSDELPFMSNNGLDSMAESFAYCPHCGARMDGGVDD